MTGQPPPQPDLPPSAPEAHWSRLIDHVPAMIGYWDKDLICRVANRAYETWFGVDPQALIGRSIMDLLGPKLFAMNERHIRAALRGEPQTFQRVVPGPDGVERHSLARYIPDCVDGQVLGFVAYVTEVTQLKRAQVELEASVASLRAEIQRRERAEDQVIDLQQELSTALNGVGAGFVATDRQGRITRFNHVFANLFGYSESEALGEMIWNVFQREGRRAETSARNPIDLMLEGGVTIDVAQQVMAIARDGHRFPLEVRSGLTHGPDGEVRGMAVVIRDQTRLRRAEDERRRAEELLRHVVDASPNALLMLDAEHIVRFANLAVEPLFGYRPEQLLDRSIDVLVPDRYREARVAFEQLLADANRGGAGSTRECVLFRKDSTALDAEVGFSPVQSSEGAFTLLTITDITERKRNQDELRRSNADLEQFAYIASHDLQEPLRMVATFTEMLGKRYSGQLDAKADSYIEHAVSGAKRMQLLVRDLLEYSRVGSGRAALRPIDARAVLEQVLVSLGPSIEQAHAEIRVEPLPRVMASAEQLAQVFQNLISNALKFRSKAPLVVTIAAAAQGDRVRFSVTDNGIGLDPAYADRIFLMFQRLHARGAHTGSGIGLAIVKRIIEGFGERIWVESSPGAGATFHFTLAPASE